MVNYLCSRCGYNTNNRTYFKKHLNRKYICNPVLNDMNITKIKEKYNINESENMKYKYQNKNMTKTTQIQYKVTKKYNCELCNTQFTTRQAKFRHKKLYCKKKKETYTTNLEKENEKLKQENEKLINIFNQLKLDKKQIMKDVEKMILNTRPQKINNYNTNTINNNIIINNYGEENIDYITDKILTKLIKHPNSCVSKLINLKHFHPSHPENRNIRITNKKLPYAEIRKEHEWKLRKKEDILEELINKNSSFLDNHYEDNFKLFNNKHKKKYEDIQNKLDSNNKAVESMAFKYP